MSTEEIRILDDIYHALSAGHDSNESLATWPLSNEGFARVDARRTFIQRGQRALVDLRKNLADGKARIEPTRKARPTACYCNATPKPPCGFCESQASTEPQP